MIGETISLAGAAMSVMTASEIAATSKDPKEFMAKYEAFAKSHGKSLKLLQTKGSLTKLIAMTIVEPMGIVSTDIKNEEYTKDILALLTDMFTAYFANAMNILTTVYEETPYVALELLSTESAKVTAEQVNFLESMLAGDLFPSMEDNVSDVKDILKEKMINQNPLNRPKATTAIRKYDSANSNASARLMESKNASLDAVLQRSVNLSFKVAYSQAKAYDGYVPKYGDSELKAATNQEELSKMLNENIEAEKEWLNKNPGYKKDTSGNIQKMNEGVQDVVVPLTIKTGIKFVSIADILNAVAPSSRNKELSFRFDEYKAGLLSLLDFVFANDLIKEYKENKFKDKTGVLELFKNRELAANKKLLGGGKLVGYEKYYNFLVLTKEEAAMLEKEAGGKLDNNVHKEAICNKTQAMFIAVVDRDSERVIIYTKDIKGVTNVRLTDIRRRSDKSYSNDMLEFVKAMSTSRPVTF